MPKLDLIEEDGQIELIQDDSLTSDIGLAVIEEEEPFDVRDESVVRLQRVANYLKRLKAADPNDNALFAELVNEGMELAGLLDRDVAREFSCAVPTVVRWTNGENAPHPFMRPRIYEVLGQKVLGR